MYEIELETLTILQIFIVIILCYLIYYCYTETYIEEFTSSSTTTNSDSTSSSTGNSSTSSSTTTNAPTTTTSRNCGGYGDIERYFSENLCNIAKSATGTQKENLESGIQNMAEIIKNNPTLNVNEFSEYLLNHQTIINKNKEMRDKIILQDSLNYTKENKENAYYEKIKSNVIRQFEDKLKKDFIN